MKRDYTLFIKDILESIEAIQRYIGNMTFEDFLKDDKTINATVHKLEIIGEATKSIPKHIRRNYPIIPWVELTKMRDKIAHFYFGIDYYIVWNVAKERLPLMKPTIEKILSEIKGGKLLNT